MNISEELKNICYRSIFVLINESFEPVGFGYFQDKYTDNCIEWNIKSYQSNTIERFFIENNEVNYFFIPCTNQKSNIKIYIKIINDETNKIIDLIKPKINLRLQQIFNIKYCNYCSKFNSNYKICGKCKLVSYCCRECQIKDWKIHKGICIKN